MALVDCIESDRTISEILGLPNTVSDYEDTLKYLTEAHIPIAPHIIVGLGNGALDGELRALEIVRRYSRAVSVHGLACSGRVCARGRGFRGGVVRGRRMCAGAWCGRDGSGGGGSEGSEGRGGERVF